MVATPVRGRCLCQHAGSTCIRPTYYQEGKWFPRGPSYTDFTPLSEGLHAAPPRSEPSRRYPMRIRPLAQTILAGLLMAVSAQAQTLNLSGAGATFPYPLYSKWFNEYNKLRPQIQINYQ